MRLTRGTWGTAVPAVVLAVAGLLATGVGAPVASAAPSCQDGGKCTLGDIGPGGGTVFYVKDGYSLETAPDGWDASASTSKVEWCPRGKPGYGVRLGTKTSIGSGLANTTLIIKKCGRNTIAGKAAAYKGRGKTWFLPSRDELKALLKFRAASGLPAASFWSSSQSSNLTGGALVTSLGGGLQLRGAYWTVPVSSSNNNCTIDYGGPEICVTPSPSPSP